MTSILLTMMQLSLQSKSFALMISLVVLALPAQADRVVNQLQFGMMIADLGLI